MPDITARLTTALADRYKIERELGAGGRVSHRNSEALNHRHYHIECPWRTVVQRNRLYPECSLHEEARLLGDHLVNGGAQAHGS